MLPTIEEFLACFAVRPAVAISSSCPVVQPSGTPSVSVVDDWNESRETFRFTLEHRWHNAGQSRKGADAILSAAMGFDLPERQRI